MGIAEDLIIIILLGLVAGFIVNRFMLPMFLGYIIVGVILGPYIKGINISNVHNIHILSEIGVALLLFSIGLESSFKELEDVKNISILGTPLQIILYSCLIFIFCIILGFNLKNSLIIGVTTSLSSTMVVFKLLETRQLIGTLSSRVMVGICLVQDLAVIPIVLFITFINNFSGNYWAIFYPIIKSIFFLFFIIWLGSKIVPIIFHLIAKYNSQELFLLTVTGVALGVGFLSYHLGLSFSLGAFIAGMLLSNTDYNHRALSDVVPLRDIFGLIFFVSIGMLFNPQFFMEKIVMILALSILIIFSKIIIFYFLCKIFGFFNIVPLATAFTLSQIGEFSFVIANMCLTRDIIDKNIYSIIISVTVISMFITPLISDLVPTIYKKMKKNITKNYKPMSNIKIENHIVIIGGSITGENIAKILTFMNIPYLVIEKNFHVYENLKETTDFIIYGDATNKSVLKAANLSKANLVLITSLHFKTCNDIITTSKILNKHIKIIGLCSNQKDYELFYNLNIDRIIFNKFEAGLEVVRELLFYLNYPDNFIQDNINKAICEYYSLYLKNSLNNSKINYNKPFSASLNMHWIQVSRDSKFLGKKVKEIESNKHTIIAVKRMNKFILKVNPELNIMENDLIAVIFNSNKNIM